MPSFQGMEGYSDTMSAEKRLESWVMPQTAESFVRRSVVSFREWGRRVASGEVSSEMYRSRSLKGFRVAPIIGLPRYVPVSGLFSLWIFRRK